MLLLKSHLSTEEKAREGSYIKSPYEFRRSWEVTGLEEEQQLSKEELLQRQIQLLQQKLEELENKIEGNGQDKEGPSRETFLSRLRSSVFVREDDDPEDEIQSQRSTASARRLGEIKTIYIKKVDLTLNGNSIGSKIRQTL